jgi:hypothetical protein
MGRAASSRGGVSGGSPRSTIGGDGNAGSVHSSRSSRWLPLDDLQEAQEAWPRPSVGGPMAAPPPLPPAAAAPGGGGSFPEGGSGSGGGKAGRTALHLAAWQGRVADVLRLAGEGMDVNAPDAEGCTPLHLACKVSAGKP